MDTQLNGILQLGITVQDIARATAFYRDVLGLKLLMEGPNMAFFDCAGVRLYLARGDGDAHNAGSGSIYFRASDLNAQCASLKANSASIHQEPHLIARMPDHDLWLMWIRDTEGNLLGIMEERGGI
jgi:predicted enzyme related to lactoylglutathione lyase